MAAADNNRMLSTLAALNVCTARTTPSSAKEGEHNAGDTPRMKMNAARLVFRSFLLPRLESVKGMMASQDTPVVVTFSSILFTIIDVSTHFSYKLPRGLPYSASRRRQKSVFLFLLSPLLLSNISL